MWLNFRRLAALFSCLLCRSPADSAGHRRRKEELQSRVEHLRRLDALDYANQSGILKKWADKYGITIQLTQINDYIDRSTSTRRAASMPA